MKFPITIRHRSSTAKIYAPGGKFAYYRLAYTTAGKRRMQTFAGYSDAKAAAERIVRELASGSQTAALNASQSRDALVALQRLESFRQVTGHRFSLLAAVSEFVEAMDKLKGRSLGESVEGFLQTVMSVRRKDVTEAVEEFLGERKHKTEAKDGKRAQLSVSYENRTAAVAALKGLGFGKSAAYAALEPDGRFSAWLQCAPDGIISWTDGHTV